MYPAANLHFDIFAIMKFLPALLIFGLLYGCTATQPTVEQNPPQETRQVRIDPTWQMPPTSAPVSIKEIQFNGDIMDVAVTYSGGCGEHLFELWTTGKFSTRYPPQLEVFLYHDNRGDHCREIQHETLYFDVSSLQYPGTNAVMLRFNDLNKSVKYAY